MKRLLSISVAALLPVGASAVILYTSESPFLAAVDPGAYTEDFGSVEIGDDLPASLNFSGNGFEYTVAAETSFLYRNQTDSTYGTWLSTFDPGVSIEITFSSLNVTAVGGNFFLTDDQESAVAGNVFVSINGGSPVELFSAASGDQPYLGIVSADDSPITSLLLTTDSGEWVTFTNFTVVPEPSVWAAILGLGALGLVGVRRLRRRSTIAE